MTGAGAGTGGGGGDLEVACLPHTQMTVRLWVCIIGNVITGIKHDK